MSSTFIRVQNIVQTLRIIASSFNNFTILKGKFDILKCYSVVQRRCIITNSTIYRISNRCAVYLTVWNVFLARAFLCSNTFDREVQVCPWSCDTHFIRTLHQVSKCILSTVHLSIIQIAHVKIKIFERLSAHIRKLCHAWIRITKHYPFSTFNPLLTMNWMRV
ncbi:hypothetical protein D3C73_1233790 [compost metagenome]